MGFVKGVFSCWKIQSSHRERKWAAWDHGVLKHIDNPLHSAILKGACFTSDVDVLYVYLCMCVCVCMQMSALSVHLIN